MKLDQTALHELQVAIADKLYLQVANWNLYLGDAGLAEPLAIECSAYLDRGASGAARQGLEGVKVPLGGGSIQLPLSRLMPSGQIFDLEEILEPYCR